MTYQVLARKWRPRRFDDMVGQGHVLKALQSALGQQRLHHAYLFTGTRGVGKTTVARIFAKCLNCELGVSATPCGQCAACQEVDSGRFVDLIEVDAASRTKVEDTRDLLDNVQYLPTRGRYKVYLIDEVHMLSNSSFNALLKTLEEPPPHVMFLLATTDPQKLPVTVLSRCLQFHLKALTPEQIVARLSHILKTETVPFEESTLPLVARAANGSLRDALSLLDQAIAHGQGQLKTADVRDMLGFIEHASLAELVNALCQCDVAAVMQAVAAMESFAPDHEAVLAELLSLLHGAAVVQQLPQSSYAEQALCRQLAGALGAADIQLYYQIALHGRRDLPLAPSGREGLEMTLLRMLAFRPVGEGERRAAPVATTSAAVTKTAVTAASVTSVTTSTVANSGNSIAEARAPALDTPAVVTAVVTEVPATAEKMPVAATVAVNPTATTATASANTSAASVAERAPSALNPDNWHHASLVQLGNQWLDWIDEMKLVGLADNLARNTALVRCDGERFTLAADSQRMDMLTPARMKEIETGLSSLLDRSITLVLTSDMPAGAMTARDLASQRAAEKQASAAASLQGDPRLNELLSLSQGRLLPDTIRSLH
ncbi:DNA polymerase III subunit gamma/tau [Permianibacter sp. IMCC34836]|uniref:DNA polymerase III subunit gamma/tau n=1 Tax=Permianibacter fluminis TaxID=2738515 RepID=UPI00155403D2|nr:DNA polymerase III subunit gamma/tau [Permianibacter fluminis]NQD38124.1 DNA polymerase III subunit gamma/tau [Permianibacter fluminis]